MNTYISPVEDFCVPITNKNTLDYTERFKIGEFEIKIEPLGRGMINCYIERDNKSIFNGCFEMETEVLKRILRNWVIIDNSFSPEG